ncbi:MAG TPA: biotin/lipoyl-containing protein, partial [Thermoanaerobaculia bacterium]|nr:biotin/lipoyl-containing protein [Thermoanaerobaculia bacterium]
DEAYDLGPANAVDPKDGQRKIRYLDYAVLRQALTDTRAEAVWVGWGLVAEHAEFADMCAEMGIVFIGPPGEVMRKLGDKITSKLLAEEADVPVSPWSGGAVENVEEAKKVAADLGYPLMIKATAGGGGRGIRKVTAEAGLEDAFVSARSEALKSFGNGTVFLEKMVSAARHVEVQVVADTHGNVWSLGVRDCSVQRRHQKLLEETPSPALTEEEDRELRAAGARMAKVADYVNAGTIEFLFDPVGRDFYFLEVNTRLQVEHPVTELVTGVDLVKLQIHVARGGALEGEVPPARGAAIEVRLNAEDPDAGFAPSPGKVEIFRPARGPGLRVDTGVDEGDQIAPEFDSMIAKVIAHGATREEALSRLARGLAQTQVVIRGGSSNKGFLQELLTREEVVSGEVDVQWLDRVSALDRGPARGAEVAVLQAAVEAYEDEVDLERTRFWATAQRGRPELGDETGRKVELRYRGETYSVAVYRTGERTYRAVVDDTRVELEVERLGRFERRLHCGGKGYRILAVDQGVDTLVEVDGLPHRISRDEQGVVRAPAPAIVVSIAVAEGDEVDVGDRLAVVEAMKMETEIRAEFAGVVTSIDVRPNVQVAAGAPLMSVEPRGEDESAAAGDRLDFTTCVADGEAGDETERCLHNLARLTQLFLGWDSEPGEPAQAIAQHGIVCQGLPDDQAEVEAAEETLLETFVDLCALFRRRPAEDEPLEGDRRSSEENLYAYLRDRGAEGEGLPAGFLATLRRALEHYGVDDLEPSPRLNESLFRLHKAHRRLRHQIAPVLGILDRRLESADVLADQVGERFHRLLHRLVDETRDRYPAVHDLAREVHYRYLDEPFLADIRWRTFTEVDEHLAYLEKNPNAADREERIRALVDCPQPVAGRFVEGYADFDDPARQAMLEVLMRRLYRVRDLDGVDHQEVRGRHYVATEYTEAGGGERAARRVFVALGCAAWDEAGEALEGAARLARKGASRKVAGAVELLLYGEPEGGPPLSGDDAAVRVQQVIEAASLPKRIDRVAVSSWAGGRSRHFTFHRDKKGWVEARLERGIHPLLAERLELWRLDNFKAERLPSDDDIYAFHGAAHDNPQDERLFVFAEVRDLSPLEDGDTVRYPYLERTLHESLAVIRRFQSKRGPRERLHWNRVTLYVWPTFDMSSSRLRRLVRRLAPATQGLGLQKVVVRGTLRGRGGARPTPIVLELSQPGGGGINLEFRQPADRAIETLSDYQSHVVRLRRRGLVYPYELIRMLAPPAGVDSDLPHGEFQEYDLDAKGRAVPVDRPPGGNRANVVIGVVRNYTGAYPEGIERVLIASDPTRGMGNLAEPECARIIAALDLAERMAVPVEWFAVSAGARISMQSGTENMDWIAKALRRLVHFTQDGGEVNLIVPGINVGAQPYWNAEATMLMHTKGILIMTPDGAMVLTGKDALDYSGGVSAEDNQGIGGFERIMGPNGQAQYLASDLADACRILLDYYRRSWVAPGERFPRQRQTTDPVERDVRAEPHGDGFETVGGVFSRDENAGRKKPFEVRKVMSAVIDRDRQPLERWYRMQDAEIGVVWDAFLGGQPVSVVGFESRPLPRMGYHPADGPEQWTSGTLFPQSS